MGGSGSGRTPDEGAARDFSMRVRMTSADRDKLDQARGGRTRSAFVRDAIRSAVDQTGRRRK